MRRVFGCDVDVVVAVATVLAVVVGCQRVAAAMCSDSRCCCCVASHGNNQQDGINLGFVKG